MELKTTTSLWRRSSGMRYTRRLRNAPQSQHHPVSGQLFFGLPNTVLVVANCLNDPTIRLKGRPSMPGWGEQGSYMKQKL
jgi:hypothetical protein